MHVLHKLVHLPQLPIFTAQQEIAQIYSKIEEKKAGKRQSTFAVINQKQLLHRQNTKVNEKTEEEESEEEEEEEEEAT